MKLLELVGGSGVYPSESNLIDMMVRLMKSENQKSIDNFFSGRFILEKEEYMIEDLRHLSDEDRYNKRFNIYYKVYHGPRLGYFEFCEDNMKCENILEFCEEGYGKIKDLTVLSIDDSTRVLVEKGNIYIRGDYPDYVFLDTEGYLTTKTISGDIEYELMRKFSNLDGGVVLSPSQFEKALGSNGMLPNRKTHYGRNRIFTEPYCIIERKVKMKVEDIDEELETKEELDNCEEDCWEYNDWESDGFEEEQHKIISFGDILDNPTEDIEGESLETRVTYNSYYEETLLRPELVLLKRDNDTKGAKDEHENSYRGIDVLTSYVECDRRSIDKSIITHLLDDKEILTLEDYLSEGDFSATYAITKDTKSINTIHRLKRIPKVDRNGVFILIYRDCKVVKMGYRSLLSCLQGIDAEEFKIYKEEDLHTVTEEDNSLLIHKPLKVTESK